jgi:16S rRNA processing protein RimM
VRVGLPLLRRACVQFGAAFCFFGRRSLLLSEYLLIGEITKPQGVGGEVKVQPLTDDPNRFLELNQVYFQSGSTYELRPVLSARVSGEYAYLSFPGVTDRDKAEALRGQKLYVDRAHAVKLSEDEVFICDLIGCEAVDMQGNAIGTLVDVLQPGTTDVYVFDTPRGRMLMPALKAAIPQVDVKARKIVLDADKLSEVAFFED